MPVPVGRVAVASPAVPGSTAVEDSKSRKASDIKAIMRAGNQCRGWNVIKRGMGQKRTPAPTMAETTDAEGKRVHCMTQESVEAAIYGEIS